MADETLYADLGQLEVIAEAPRGIPANAIVSRTLSVGGNTATAGMVATGHGETYPAIDLAITTDVHADYVILKPVTPSNMTNYTLDSTITDAEDVWCLDLNKCKGLDIEVYLRLEAAAGPIAIEIGDDIAIGTEAGKVRKFVYADATAATDSFIERVGKALEVDAGSATDDHWIKVGV